MNKEQLIKNLEATIKKLKKDSVSCRGTMELYRSSVSGVDPENWQFEINYPNGKMEIEFRISLYDKEDDESDDAFDPMDSIRL